MVGRVDPASPAVHPEPVLRDVPVDRLAQSPHLRKGEGPYRALEGALEGLPGVGVHRADLDDDPLPGRTRPTFVKLRKSGLAQQCAEFTALLEPAHPPTD